MMGRKRPAKVYFIKPVGMAGPVKIGCSSLPERRLVELTIWSPFQLEVVVAVDGNEDLEWRLHASFAADRSHSEWFHASDRLTATMAAIADGSFDFASLPAPKRLKYRTTTKKWTEHAKISASMNSRIRALVKRGVSVPKEITSKAWSYGNTWDAGAEPFQVSEADAVQAFLALHGYAPRPVPPHPNEDA